LHWRGIIVIDFTSRFYRIYPPMLWWDQSFGRTGASGSILT
jgi:hypothetical protein